MKLKLDLHVHTILSEDAYTRPDELATNLRRAGLDGLAITDHNILSNPSNTDALFIPGVEISSHEGHIIGLGIHELIPKGLSADETIQRIRELKGVSIVAHPYDVYRSAIRPENLTVMPDALEVINSASIFHSITWKKAEAFAERNNLTRTAGSDSHIPQTIGRGYTIVDSRERTVASILDAIRNGLTEPHGVPVTLGDRVRKLSRRL